MHQAIPHPAGLFSGRIAARWTAAGWATNARAERPGGAARIAQALALGALLGLIGVGGELLREVAALRRDQAAAAPAVFPDQPAPLPPDACPDPPAPPAPEAAPMPMPVPPAATPANGRIADADTPDDRTLVTVIATAYCPCALCCGDDADGHTAIMRDAWRHRGIAVDPRLIPYHTMLTVPGYGRAMVDDTGAAMRRDGERGIVHLDVRFHTHAQAEAWGVRQLVVAVPVGCPAAALGSLARDAETP
jgi:3D (Asp-Asp-Asp) domain-containing protein